MTLEILLKEEDISGYSDRAKLLHRSVIELQSNNISRIFGSNSRETDLTQKVSATFNGIYALVNDTIIKSRLNAYLPMDARRAYSTMVASEVILSKILSKNDDDFVIANSNSDYLNNFLKYTTDDKATASGVMLGFVEYLQTYRRYNNIEHMLAEYYSAVSESTVNYLYNVHDSKTKALSGINFTGKNFKIEGLNQITTKFNNRSYSGHSTNSNKSESEGRAMKNRDSDLLPPPKVPLIEEVLFDDVIGNDEAKIAIKRSLDMIFAYRINEQRNIELDKKRFQQHIVLIGPPATGKSMLLKAANTYFTQKKDQYNVPGECVTLGFESMMQDGALLNLQYQLKCISDPQALRLILIDEGDKILPPRGDAGLHQHEKRTVTELMEFIDGIKYHNYGNYMFIINTNIPAKLDPAVRSRLGTYTCRGPVTLGQREQLLRNHYEGYRKKGGIIGNIDYADLGKLSLELKLDPRKLNMVRTLLTADNSKTSYPDEFYHQNTSLKEQEKIMAAATKYSPLTGTQIAKKMYEVASMKDDADQVTREFDKLHKY